MFSLMREGYRVLHDLSVREEDSGGMVYDPVEDRIFSMNATAFFVVTLCDGNHTRKEMIRKFAGRFEQPMIVAGKNVDLILESLLSRNLVVKVICNH